MQNQMSRMEGMFKNQISELVKIYGSQSAMSRVVGIPQSTIGNWATGKTTPNQNQLSILLQALPDINARWLITGIGTMYKSECSHCIQLKEAEDRSKKILNMYLEDKKTVWPLIELLYNSALQLSENKELTTSELRKEIEK